MLNVSLEASNLAYHQMRKSLKIPLSHLNSLSDVGNRQRLWLERVGHFLFDSRCPVRTEPCFARDGLKNQHKSAYDHSDVHHRDASATQTFISIFDQDARVMVRILRDGIDQRKWSGMKNNYSEDREKKDLINPSIHQVSELFTLNEKKHVAFSIACSALLDSFSRAIQRDSQGVPLRMYIGGVGGTRKSRIIEAFRYLSKAWGQPNAVQTVASTGIAAVLIKG